MEPSKVFLIISVEKADIDKKADKRKDAAGGQEVPI